jgi:uncharacterized protein (UPF0332 family)
MEPWQAWYAMALESQRAALAAESAKCWRSSVSRYYYAAYQAVTAVLLYSGLIPPDLEEAWSHAATPDLLEEHFTPYVRSRDARKRLNQTLGELYKLRIIADYRGNAQLEKRIGGARKYANRLVNVAGDILLEG